MTRTIICLGAAGSGSAAGTAILSDLTRSPADHLEQWLRIAGILMGTIVVPAITLYLAHHVRRKVTAAQPCGGNVNNCPFAQSQDTLRGD